MNRLFKFGYFFCVFFLGFVFFTSGMAKLFSEHRFFGFIGPVWLEDKLVEHSLGLLGRFVAYAQVVIGFSLLTYRFRYIASLMLVPMLANIFVIVVSLHWRGTPYVVAFLLLQNIYLLLYDRHQYLHLITGKLSTSITQNENKLLGNIIWLLGFGLMLASIQLSFFNLPTAWTLAILSLFISFFSGKLEQKLAK